MHPRRGDRQSITKALNTTAVSLKCSEEPEMRRIGHLSGSERKGFVMSKPHHQSILYQSIKRLDGQMAIGTSRYEAKQELRAKAVSQEESGWSVSDYLIRSYKTREIYQDVSLKFVSWVRATYGIKDLRDLDPRAEELASCYLDLRLQAGKSPSTLKTERSALRLFFSESTLAESILLPKRTRQGITRSRYPVARDRKFQPANWQPLLTFEKAVGLRKNELRRILVKEVYIGLSGQLVAYVSRGKGGKAREAPVLPGRAQDVLAVIAGRDPEERVFPRLPDTEVQDLRREYAQQLYLYYAGPGWSLPPTDRRLRPTDYDPEAVDRVSKALGHNRRDVVLNNYLR